MNYNKDIVKLAGTAPLSNFVGEGLGVRL